MTTESNQLETIEAAPEPIATTLSRHKALRAVVDAFKRGQDVVVACPTHANAGYVQGVLLDTMGMAELSHVGVRRAAGSLAIYRTHTPRAHSIQFLSHHGGGAGLRGLSAALVVAFNPSTEVLQAAVPVVLADPAGRVVIVRGSSQ